VTVQSLASAALAFSIHPLWCSLSIKCAFSYTPRQRVACLLNHMKPSLTHIFALSFGRCDFLWPRLCVNSAAPVFVVSNCSPRLLAQLILFAAHLSCIVVTWLIWLPVATQPRLSTKANPLADKYSSTHYISPEVQIAKRIDDTGDPCVTPASTGCLSMALPWITIPIVLSERMLAVHHIRSPSICLTFITVTSLPFSTLGEAAWMSMRSTPVMWPFFQAA